MKRANMSTEPVAPADQPAGIDLALEATISSPDPVTPLWRTVLAITAIAALCAVVGIFPIERGDVFSNVVTGGYIWQHQQIPPTDPFSYTGPHHWSLSHSVTSLLFFAAHLVTGLSGIQILCAAVLCLAYSLSYYVWEQRTKMPLASFVVVALAVLCSCYWFNALTDCLGYLLTAIYLLLITSSARHAILWTIPLQMVWANTHPSAAIGMCLVTIWCAVRAHTLTRVDRYGALVTLAVLAVNILNPSGLVIYQCMYRALFNSYHASNAPSGFIQLQWLSPCDSRIAALPQSCWFFGSLIITALLIHTHVRCQHSIRTSQHHSRHVLTILSTLALLALSLVSSRYIPFYYLSLVALALTTFGYISAQPPGNYIRALQQNYRLIAWGVLVATIMLIARIVLFGYLSGDIDRRIGFGINARAFPSKPIQILTEASAQGRAIHGNIFSDYHSEPYFLYQTYPHYKVYLGSARADQVYNEKLFDHYLLLHNHNDILRSDISRYDIRAFIISLPPSERGILAPHRLLTSDPAWKLAYFDDSHMLFIRGDEAQAQNIPTFSHLNPFGNISQLVKSSPEVDAALLEDLNRARQIAPNSISVMVLHVLYYLAKDDPLRAKEFALEIEGFCQKYDPTTECRKIASPQLIRFQELLR